MRLLLTLFVLLAATSALALDPPKSEDQKTLYAIGASVNRSLAVFNLSPSEFDRVMQGVQESHSGKNPGFEVTGYNQKIQELARARRKAEGDRQITAGRDFLEKAAKEKGALKTASGMVYNSLLEGKGSSPKADDTVKVNYRGTLIDGTEFDSSFKRGQALEFKLSNVIKCWVEGVQKMKPGGKAKLICPPNLAYGDNGAGELILPGATLLFEIELLGFTPAGVKSVSPAVPAPTSKVK
ncbi:FKBP-type peptidyl-prolyl cis-trans isomerase [Trichlorobacter lovleyi]|uniref:FKBP-type peptidyl-prolyl cis-trans isomerase n=1 Tax=Trichlorobacter lovleyi TaxID=313985 RepID=UPI003D0CAEC1